MSTDVTLRYLLLGEDKSATAAVEGVASKADTASSAVGSSFAKMGEVIGGEIGEVIGRVGEGLSSIGEAAGGIAPKLAAGGAAATGIGVALSVLGSKARQSQNELKQAFQGAGVPMEEYEARIESAIKANQNLAISEDETKSALATMIQMTNDASGSLDHMGLVADLAAARHISLDTAARLVAGSMNGNTKLFKMYGIVVDSTSAANSKLTKAQQAQVTATSTLHESQVHLRDVHREVATGALKGADAQDALKEAQKEVAKASEALKAKQDKVKAAVQGVKQATDEQAAGFDQLSHKLDGAAKASVDSFTGRLDVLKTKAGDVLSEFGNKWGPVIQTAGATAAIFAGILEFSTKIALGTRIQLGLLTIQTYAMAAAARIAAAAQFLLDAAMDANPIGLVVIAIAALVAGFIIAWKHSQTFRTIVTAVMNAVKNAAVGTFNWIKDHWKLILSILGGPFVAAAILIVSHWHQIKAGASDAVGGIKSAWNGFIGFFKGLPGRIASIAGNLWGSIKEGFRSMINGIIDLWNSLHFSIPSVHAFGKTLGGGSIGVPHVNHLARGGVLTTAGSVVVGDGGNGSGAELLDLPAGARVRPLAGGEGSGSAGTGGDLGTFTIVVQSEDGTVTHKKLLKLKRERGGLALGLA